MRLIDFFDRGLRLQPDSPCLAEPGGRALTYRQCADLSHRLANGLHDAGVAKGSNVGLLAGNRLLTFVAILGTVRSAGTWLPVNARNAMSENIHVLANGDCEFLFVDSAFAAELPAIRAALPRLRAVVCIDRALAGAPGLEEWAAQQRADPVFVDQRPGDVVAIRGTGGTTGMPRGVLVTHRVYATLFANFFASMPMHEPPVHLVVAPLTHAAGAVAFAACAWGGVSLILPSAEPGALLEAIERHRVSLLFLPPTVIYRLLAHPDVRRRDYSSLRHFIYSAAPMSVDKLREALDVFGQVMVQGYGQAEAPFFATCMTTRDHRVEGPDANRRLASCGRATPFTVVEIMDDDGRVLGPNERGEIVVRGDLVMQGYYKNPEATAAALQHGWLHTGDIGYRDDAGYFYIVDRKKDLIISGGFNIYPSEVEQVLWSHPAVQDCAVIGVPDDIWGEAVKAIVELHPGAQAEPAEILDYCRGRLGAIKTPKSVEIWAALPRSQIGKVLKRELRDKFWQGRERRI